MFGLTEYGRMTYMLKMAEHFKEINLIEQRKAKDKGREDYYDQKIEGIGEKIVKSLHELAEYAKTHRSKAVVVYIQFRSMSASKKAVEQFSVSKARRCFLICCGKKGEIEGRYLSGLWPKVQRAPEPTVINWQNLKYGRCSRKCRSIISTLVGLLLMAVSFYVIIRGKQLEAQHAENFAQIECGQREPTFEEAQADSLKAENAQQGMVNCYCQAEFLKSGPKAA